MTVMNPEDIRSRQINEWLWIDANGNPHVDIPEALKAEGVEDTPETRAELTQVVTEICNALGCEHINRPNPIEHVN